jgi:anti-sigma B factor antagonist
MKIRQEGSTLRVSGIVELGAANTPDVRKGILEALEPCHRSIEFDLSETAFVDSCGLGVLVALYKETIKREGNLQILYPTAPVQQILELTRLHRLFTIISRESSTEESAAGPEACFPHPVLRSKQ